MPKYVIERDMPAVGSLPAAELGAASRVSNEVLAKLSPRVKWQQSFVTADKIYCVYIADDEDAVREHADLAGLPANRISQVVSTIDPTTGE